MAQASSKTLKRCSVTPRPLADMSLTSEAFVLAKPAPGVVAPAPLRTSPHRSAAGAEGSSGGLRTSGVILAAAALRQAYRGASTARRAENGTTVVNVDSEDIEVLAKGAAKLRAEAAQLEAEQEELRRKERQAFFKILDTDDSGALDAQECRKA